jgi:hypothetical protein
MWIEEGRRSTGGGLTVLVLADFIATEPVEGVACRSPFALSDSPTARQRDSHRFVSFRAWIQRSCPSSCDRHSDRRFATGASAWGAVEGSKAGLEKSSGQFGSCRIGLGPLGPTVETRGRSLSPHDSGAEPAGSSVSVKSPTRNDAPKAIGQG